MSSRLFVLSSPEDILLLEWKGGRKGREDGGERREGLGEEEREREKH